MCMSRRREILCGFWGVDSSRCTLCPQVAKTARSEALRELVVLLERGSGRSCGAPICPEGLEQDLARSHKRFSPSSAGDFCEEFVRTFERHLGNAESENLETVSGGLGGRVAGSEESPEDVVRSNAGGLGDTSSKTVGLSFEPGTSFGSCSHGNHARTADAVWFLVALLERFDRLCSPQRSSLLVGRENFDKVVLARNRATVLRNFGKAVSDYIHSGDFARVVARRWNGTRASSSDEHDELYADFGAGCSSSPTLRTSSKASCKS